MSYLNKLNVMFIATSSSSIVWWRMQNFVQAAWKLGIANFVNPLWQKDYRDIQEWQEKIEIGGEKYDPIFTRAFIPSINSGIKQKCTDAIVFQSAHRQGAMDLFESIKEEYPYIPLLTEIDDNILSVPAYNESFATYAPGSEVRARIKRQMELSDGVIVSTPYLKDIYSDFNKNIYVIPNSIDFEQWDKLKRKSRSGIRIGWAGGTGREGDFKEYIPAIINIAKKYPDVKFVFINGPAHNGLPEELRGFKNIEHQLKWSPILKYPKMMLSLDFDIGIAPLWDSAFNRGKSNLKWLENSAMKIPTVSSNVGHMKELTHGKDVLLANNANEFEVHLEKLIKDRSYRKALGLRAYESAKKRFNVADTVNKYAMAIRELKFLKDSENLPKIPTSLQVKNDSSYAH